MSIVTKKGDEGRTRLRGPLQVGKDDIRVEVCGELDELCSFLGLARSLVKSSRVKAVLKEIQSALFLIGAEICTSSKDLHSLRIRIGPEHVSRLETIIFDLEAKAKTRRSGFCIPGENPQSAVIDVARAVARRTERRVVAFGRKKRLKNSFIIPYLNRCSDLLFLLARSLE